MLPPGRRRTGALGPASFLLLTLFLFANIASAASAVLGIDLGTEYLKAALVKPGIPLEIVLSKDSKRKEASAVALKTPRNPVAGAFPERAYGGDALALGARFPGDVYPNLKPLLGLREEVVEASGSPGVEYRARHPSLAMTGVEGRGTVGFKSPSFVAEDDAVFSVEELLAMELQNLRENAETLAGKGTRISDAVITVPAFYTAEEKRAVELAAELAGLKVLGMVSDGLAVGINYATSRTFPSINEGGKPEYHLVFDMGAGSTTATVLKFQGRTVKDVGRYNKTIQEVQVMGTGWDKTLGGDSLNGLIMDHMIEQFAETPAAKSASVKVEDVKKHGRTAAKLFKEAEKVRQVLSANQATGTSFEGLYDDVDFKYRLTRAEFEEMVVPYAERVAAPVEQALEAAGLTFADLESVILHGGAIRTPFVQRKLETLAGDASKLRTNVNADEAAVFGAAFKGAGLSPSFRVKEIRDSDAANFAAGLRYTWNGKERSQKLFTPTSRVGTVKEMPIKTLEDFEFTLYQQIPDVVDPAQLVERPIMSVKTQNLTASVAELVEKEGCDREDINTKFSLKLDSVFGLPEVAKAEVSCEVEGSEKKGGVVDDVKGFFGFGGKKGDQEPLKEGEEAETTETEAKTTETASKKAEESKAPKKRTVTSAVAFTTERKGFEKIQKAEMKRMKDRLSAFDASDRARRAREEALNVLEAFTYRARDLLSDDNFVAASTTEQRSAIEDLLHTTSDWLYGEGADADEATLKAKLKALKDLVNPIQTRKEEASKRPEQIKHLQDALEQTQSMLNLVKDEVEKAAAASASAESASSSSSSTTPSPSPSSADDLEDLDDAPTTDEPAPSTPSYTPVFTPSDLTSLSQTYDTISTWLSTKLAEQEALGPHEEAALSSTELEAKAKQLQDATMALIGKQMRGAREQKEGKKSRSSKSKKAEKTKKAKAAESAGSTTVVETPVAEGTPAAKSGDGVQHEEL
ncbi:actin-like ATPase domain-containing protein [Saccharata proteae CBS 121410]|uniref:Actin-like ATPase domain-containing protein n=1 Tax=Saccharata proteae CBS 121410 TaxID=1314787 RepID=A0A9P4HLY5_9PEZI|nr:actin-like ATPase domain-containing protein [Saccharata proteae CBS 121410]